MNIYYFSGTGNSLAVAKKLNEFIGAEGKIQCITESFNENSIIVDTDILGFVFPVYFMDVPDVFKVFIDKLEFISKPYIFTIATCNGKAGMSLNNVNKHLVNKKPRLSSGFVIQMPGNAIVTPPEVESERLNKYEKRVFEISTIINNREIVQFEENDNLKTHIISYLLKSVGKKLYLTPQNALTISDCIGCGVCEKVCSLNNIKMVNNKPQWGNNCATCLACFHWCPKKAIRAGKMLNKRKQYHNPKIYINDFILKR